MDCPIDGTVLALSERQGIEIDYCPKCRGVWLDRGELDKLLERADDHEDQVRREYDRSYERPREQHHGDYRKKKKKSFLGEFLEFGD